LFDREFETLCAFIFAKAYADIYNISTPPPSVCRIQDFENSLKQVKLSSGAGYEDFCLKQSAQFANFPAYSCRPVSNFDFVLSDDF
jgi:hypothetical protein